MIERWREALLTVATIAVAAPSAVRAEDDGIPVDRARYANRQLLPDFTAPDCSNNPRSLVQLEGNLYRHTTGAGLAVHSGLVLITRDGALLIDPAMTCTAGWLRDEIRNRFHVPVKYVVLTHAHADHISGAQVFQKDGAIVVANMRALEPIVGEKIPTAMWSTCTSRSSTSRAPDSRGISCTATSRSVPTCRSGSASTP